VSRSLLNGKGFRFTDFPAGFEQLSEREALCIDGKLGGLSVKEIAFLLGVNHSTVSTYTTRAFEKLGVASGEELVWLLNGRPMGSYQQLKDRRLFPFGRSRSILRRDKKTGAS